MAFLVWRVGRGTHIGEGGHYGVAGGLMATKDGSFCINTF